MRTRVTIRLLTGDDLLVDGPVPVVLRGKYTRALLALLALTPGEPVSRDRIAGLLWPDSDQRSARASLRMTLLSLRRALEPAAPDIVIATQETIMLDVPAENIDAVRFERLCAQSDPDARLTALNLYQGDLLAAFPLPGSGVSDLLNIERERLREMVVATGTALVSAFEGSGDQGKVRMVASKLLVIEPASEPVHRAMMRVFSSENDRAAALRQFGQCRDALGEFYDLEPSSETVDLRNRILEGDVAVPETGRLPPSGATALTHAGGTEFRALFNRRRLLAGAITVSGIALATGTYFAFTFATRETKPAPAPLIAVSVAFAADVPRKRVDDTKVNATLERALGGIPGVIFFSGAKKTGELSALSENLYHVDIVVEMSDDRVRIFAKGWRDGAPDENWMEKHDFDAHSVDQLEEWLKNNIIPRALRTARQGTER